MFAPLAATMLIALMVSLAVALTISQQAHRALPPAITLVTVPGDGEVTVVGDDTYAPRVPHPRRRLATTG